MNIRSVILAAAVMSMSIPGVAYASSPADNLQPTFSQRTSFTSVNVSATDGDEGIVAPVVWDGDEGLVPPVKWELLSKATAPTEGKAEVQVSPEQQYNANNDQPSGDEVMISTDIASEDPAERQHDQPEPSAAQKPTNDSASIDYAAAPAENKPAPSPAPVPEPEPQYPQLLISGYCHETIDQPCAQRTVDQHPYSMITFDGTNLTTIAAHWDTTIENLQPGDIIAADGIVYQVDYIYLIPWGHSLNTGDLPGGLAFQTCTGNGIRLAYAHQI